jgi:hypothetical protein
VASTPGKLLGGVISTPGNLLACIKDHPWLSVGGTTSLATIGRLLDRCNKLQTSRNTPQQNVVLLQQYNVRLKKYVERREQDVKRFQRDVVTA